MICEPPSCQSRIDKIQCKTRPVRRVFVCYASGGMESACHAEGAGYG